MNSRKERLVDGTFLPIPRRDSLSPDVRSVNGDMLRKKKPSRRLADLSGDQLPPEVIAEYRARIARGTYDLPAMRHALALRLLESGDI